MREGAGVFDPIASLKLTEDFYRVDTSLHIDLVHLEHVLAHGAAVVVFIHYFGRASGRSLALDGEGALGFRSAAALCSLFAMYAASNTQSMLKRSP